MRTSILSLGLLPLLIGCATLDDVSPFRRAAEGWLPSVEEVCVFALQSETRFEGDDAAKLEELAQLLLMELQARGFRVAPPAATQAAWDRGVEKVGAIFDPHTGRRNDARYDEARRAAFAELAGSLGCDVSLRASLVRVFAPWSGVNLHWDGAELYWPGGSRAEGWVSALSLWVVVHTMDGEAVYFGTGGIEPTARAVGVLDFSNLRSSQLLLDVERNRAGLMRALEGLDRRERVPTPRGSRARPR